MKYRNHRAEPYFTFLKNGQKTIEGRIRKEKYRLIKPGDEIEVFNRDESEKFDVVVKRVAPYATFEEMLEKEGIKKLLPDLETVPEGVKIYRKIYSLAQEKEFGVVAIEVEKK